MLALAIIGKACSILFFFGAWWCYIPPKQVENKDQEMSDDRVAVLNNGTTNHVVTHCVPETERY